MWGFMCVHPLEPLDIVGGVPVCQCVHDISKRILCAWRFIIKKSSRYINFPVWLLIEIRSLKCTKWKVVHTARQADR